ncbi:MAG: SH3 domain-containing protein, partial [Fibrobacter sp.]|nr:SH3 domain-containing protein [Fibrobacter sp.]
MKKFILLFLSVLVIPYIVFAQKQIEISNFYAKVYLAPNTTSRFIGLAQKGEVYQVISENNSWYQIQFKVSMGWVNTADTKIYDPNAKAEEPADTSVNTATADSQVQDSAQPTAADNSSSSAASDTAVKKTSSESQTGNQPSQTAQTSAPRSSQESSSGSSKTEDKSQSKIRDWFTKQNPFNIEHTDDIQGEIKQDEYYQVVLGPARILPYLDPSAPLLGMAKKGDSYRLIGRGDSWCKIAYGDSVGWIETKNGKIVDAPSDVLMTDLLFIGVIIGIILVLVVIIMVIIRIKSKKNDVKGIAVKKNVLFVAKIGKNIQDTFGENSVSLDKCFTEIGFKVKIAKDTNSIFNYLNTAFPDVVMVDWNFDRNAIGIVERTFFNVKRVNEILIIMYNVPDPSSMPPSHVL